MDRITLKHVVAYGRHGANPGERDRRQPFVIDLSIDVDLLAAESSDDLADTVDYANLRRDMVAMVETESFHLLERLAGKLLELVFADTRISAARLSVGKPQLLDGATPAVTLVRDNPAFRVFR